MGAGRYESGDHAASILGVDDWGAEHICAGGKECMEGFMAPKSAGAGSPSDDKAGWGARRGCGILREGALCDRARRDTRGKTAEYRSGDLSGGDLNETPAALKSVRQET